MEDIQTIAAIATSLIGVVTAIYKIGFKTDYSRLEGYYEQILKPFITAYQKRNNINAVNF